MMRFLILAAVLPVAACATVPPIDIPRELAGSFGGNHVAMELTPQGGTLDYDCASGTIGPIVPRVSGNFTASGTYTPGHGGPIRVGEIAIPRSVLFSGRVDVDSLSLSGTLGEGATIGPFILIRGATPTIYRCL